MLALLLLAVAPPAPPVPLRHAHAHNDYAHGRPLLDALAHGFTSVEADVFLTSEGELLVGHTRAELRKERTLKSLYLDPLRKRVQANQGKVYANGPPFYLLIDLKTEGKRTYEAVDRLLRLYPEVFSTYRDGTFERKAVTAVISGNCPREVLIAQKSRLAGIDGRPADLDSDAPAHLMPFLSASWGSLFRWRGEGRMPEGERQKLRTLVSKAHKHGRLVRFWATPESPAMWRELRAAGVDLINTDRLAELQEFLLREDRR